MCLVDSAVTLMPAAQSTQPPSPIPTPSHRPRAFVANAVIAGKYVLVRRLGAGGMGVVWVAHNRVLDVHVAMKVIDLEQTPSPKRVAARLLQEARAAARIAHPAICRVFDFGETEAGDPFIVSELLHGETLGSLMAQTPRMDARQAVQFVLPIVHGLGAAHAKGIVHRDIKPDNIFLSRDDVRRLQPKLLDFGIARLVDADHKITLDGTLLGTPDYMSPEQARGEGALDARTDIWSLAVVLYELVTGTLPFGGDNYNALLWCITQQNPASVTDLGAGDAALWSIISRALAKDRDERWGSMQEIGVALASWLLARAVKEDVCGASLSATWLGKAGAVAAPGALADSTPPTTRLGSAFVETPTVPPPAVQLPLGVAEGHSNTGVFARPLRVSRGGFRWKLAGIAAGVALVVGFAIVTVLDAPWGFETGVVRVAASSSWAVESRPPLPVGHPPPARSVAGPAAASVSVVTSSSVAATSSAPVPGSGRAVYPRRPPRKPDPRTYDFGF
ncbi:MAG: serine/threonine protein kinase [Polyangiaceae bacterium]|nr:serine/threonine protein kinase [Polyangiaceae bacterium]